jgi:hypothetical protein
LAAEALNERGEVQKGKMPSYTLLSPFDTQLQLALADIQRGDFGDSLSIFARAKRLGKIQRLGTNRRRVPSAPDVYSPLHPPHTVLAYSGGTTRQQDSGAALREQEDTLGFLAEPLSTGLASRRPQPSGTWPSNGPSRFRTSSR